MPLHDFTVVNYPDEREALFRVLGVGCRVLGIGDA